MQVRKGIVPTDLNKAKRRKEEALRLHRLCKSSRLGDTGRIAKRCSKYVFCKEREVVAREQLIRDMDSANNIWPKDSVRAI